MSASPMPSSPSSRTARPAGRSCTVSCLADGGRTYESAGVSLAAAEAVVERLRAAVESTGAEGFGAFAGLYPLDERRLLAASTDGVGTKLVLARRAARLRDPRRHLAAHRIDDLLT